MCVIIQIQIQSWWHKSSQLEVGSLLNKRYVRYDNSLVISAFKAADFEPEIHSTTYKCQASNSLGTIVSRDVLINAGKYCFQKAPLKFSLGFGSVRLNFLSFAGLAENDVPELEQLWRFVEILKRKIGAIATC